MLGSFSFNRNLLLKIFCLKNRGSISPCKQYTQIRKLSIVTHKLISAVILYAHQAPGIFFQDKSTVVVRFRLFGSNSHIKDNKMVDPRRVASYEDVLKFIHQPEKVLIDVRSPDEVNTTGKIPSSINIPLSSVQDVLVSMSEEEFRKHYQRNKPMTTDELIFYCHSGKRSTEALDIALKLGYSNSKTYLGSWNEWSRTKK